MGHYWISLNFSNNVNKYWGEVGQKGGAMAQCFPKYATASTH